MLCSAPHGTKYFLDFIRFFKKKLQKLCVVKLSWGIATPSTENLVSVPDFHCCGKGTPFKSMVKSVHKRGEVTTAMHKYSCNAKKHFQFTAMDHLNQTSDNAAMIK